MQYDCKHICACRHQSVGKSICRSVCQPVYLSVSRLASVSLSASLSVSPSVIQSCIQSVSPSVIQSVSQSVSLSSGIEPRITSWVRTDSWCSREYWVADWWVELESDQSVSQNSQSDQSVCHTVCPSSASSFWLSRQSVCHPAVSARIYLSVTRPSACQSTSATSVSRWVSLSVSPPSISLSVCHGLPRTVRQPATLRYSLSPNLSRDLFSLAHSRPISHAHSLALWLILTVASKLTHSDALSRHSKVYVTPWRSIQCFPPWLRNRLLRRGWHRGVEPESMQPISTCRRLIYRPAHAPR